MGLSKNFGNAGCQCRSQGLNFSLFLLCSGSHYVLLSEVFGDGTKKVLVDGREMKALGIFKKGIQPQWEDPANENGCQLDALKPLNNEAIDLNWENLVFGLIGETIDEDENICGARLVFSQKKGKIGYKLEVWLRRKDEDAAIRIRAKLSDILSEGSEKLKSTLRFNSEDFTIEKRKK